MKVLVISHSYISPINRVKWLEFAKHYPQVHLTVLVPQKWKTSFFSIENNNLESENIKNCSFVALPTYFTSNELVYFYYPISFIKLLQKYKPEIIHVEQGLHALSYFQAIVCNKILRLKAKCSFFTWINWNPPLSIKMKFFTKIFGYFNAHNSAGALAGNTDAKKILAATKTTLPIEVLPQLGVNIKIFKPAHNNHNNGTVKYITYVGRIIEEKGLINLVGAFSKLANQFVNWNLRIVGSGELEKELIDFAIRKKLLNRIEFHAPVHHEKIAQIMQMTDIFVLPSLETPMWREQFGHVLIEAMACRVCVVGSNAGEIPNVIANAGAIFEQGNEQALYEILSKLITQPFLRKTLAEKGLSRVMHEYTHEVIAQKTFNFWSSLKEK